MIYGELSDQELSTRLKGGDDLAFAEIYDRFFGLLYVHACGRLNDSDEASDLIQDLFTSIWSKRESFQLSTTLANYLYRAVRNRILNIIEHKKVSNRYMESLAGFVNIDYRYADYQIREKDLARVIEKEIDALPDPMKIIFIMSRRESRSYKEIAEILNSTEQAVKSQMKRALKILRTRLGFFAFIYFLIKFF